MDSIEEIGGICWGSADGRRTCFKDMSIPFLVNVINWIKDRPNTYHRDLLSNIERYASHRAFILMSDKQNYPYQKDDGRWAMYDFVHGENSDTTPPDEYVHFVTEHYPEDIAKVLAKGK